jgi:hypothetical protein
MMYYSRTYIILFLSVVLMMGLCFHTHAQDAEQIVSAKIGIKIYSDDGARWARSTERVNVGDTIRIFVVPKEDSFVYIVHSDKKTVSPLISEKRVGRDTSIVLPFNNERYQVDGSSERELITIICSPDRLVNVWALLKSATIPYAEWANTEKKLIDKSKIIFSRDPALQARILIGGSVRNLPGQTSAESDEVTYQITLLPAVAESCPAPLTFSATNLPPGLGIDATTGLISGTLTSEAAAGSPYAVTVSVLSRNNDCFSSTFTWTVLDNPGLTKDIQELQTFSGKSLLVRTYEFTVKK